MYPLFWGSPTHCVFFIEHDGGENAPFLYAYYAFYANVKIIKKMVLRYTDDVAMTCPISLIHLKDKVVLET